MKGFVLFLVSALVFISTARRLEHLNQKPYAQHLISDVTNIEKKIFNDVLTDKDISQTILDGKAGTPDFKKTMIKKTLSVIGNNDDYLKPLAQKFFSKIRFNINDDEKHKVLQLAFRDDNYTTLFAENKFQERLKRAIELVTQDKALTQSLANQAFKDNELGKQLSEQQRVALFKIFVSHPQAIRKGTVPDDVVKDILKEVENDNDLKDFYGKHKEDFAAKLIRNS